MELREKRTDKSAPEATLVHRVKETLVARLIPRDGAVVPAAVVPVLLDRMVPGTREALEVLA